MAKKPGLNLDELISLKKKQITVQSSMSTKGFIGAELTDVRDLNISARFESAVNGASENIAINLKSALDEALESSVWGTLSGTADIYDTGLLLKSGSVVSTGDGIAISYTAPYASLVHYGGYIHPYGNTNTKVYLPPRPWIQSVLTGNGPIPKFDIAEYYINQIMSEFSG